jgi:hypothetical protein
MLNNVVNLCKLHSGALNIRVSDQIEQIDDVIKDYSAAEKFFEKTFITDGMKTLITQGLMRLAGKSSTPVFHLKQAMGGGKTHIMIGLAMLAKYPKLREKYCPSIGAGFGFGETKIASFNGRTSPDEYFWGELANKLDNGAMFKKFWLEKPKAPDENDWIQLFSTSNEPILILLDEMPPYFHYYNTQKVGNGTVADIITRAFSNMLSAASKKSNVCIVISDLAAAYEQGSHLIQHALTDAKGELGRQEFPITPVDLTGNEIYEIIRKRLFLSLPSKSVIQEIANAYAEKLIEASKIKLTTNTVENLASEIEKTYPFHPSLKNVIALFKENEKFKQTRGLIELISRLLKSVWENKEANIFLIGPQHFDLSIEEVREKINEISEMRDVISNDIWNSNNSSKAQLVDLSAEVPNNYAQQISRILLTSSLSTSVNNIQGLTRENLIEYLLTPYEDPNDYITSFEQYLKESWYLHKKNDGRYYFAIQENLTKMLQSYASDAQEHVITEIKQQRIKDLFKPNRKHVYDSILAPGTSVEQCIDTIKSKRVLMVIEPEVLGKIPPDIISGIFNTISQKNNILVLTGGATSMATLNDAAKNVYAIKKAKTHIREGHAHYAELEEKSKQYQKDLTDTAISLFDKVIIPIFDKKTNTTILTHRNLSAQNSAIGFDGEEQIEKVLANPPKKFLSDLDSEFDFIKEKMETLLWKNGSNEERWVDIQDSAKEHAGMIWLPPNSLEKIKTIAISRGFWEDLGTGVITKKPTKKKTSAQVTIERDRNDDGLYELKIEPIDAGKIPNIYYAEDDVVSFNSNKIGNDGILKTKAMIIQFLIEDKTGNYETGETIIYKQPPKIRIKENGRNRELLVVPIESNLKYTLNGSNPRDGIVYNGRFSVPDEGCTILAYAEKNGIETQENFKVSQLSKNSQEIEIKQDKPVEWISEIPQKIDNTGKVFQSLTKAKDKDIKFKNDIYIKITDSQNLKNISFTAKTMEYSPQELEDIINLLIKNIQNPVITFKFNSIEVPIGYNLKDFFESLDMWSAIKQSEVKQ